MARKCRHCKTELPKVKDCQDVYQKNGYCDLDHMAVHGLAKSKATKEKAERKELANKKKESAQRKRDFYAGDIKTRKAAAKKACHDYIRTRDAGKPCICCGRALGPKYDAGHFLESGNNSILRYNEDNIHAQSVYCNQYKGGDSDDYEGRLRKKIGNDRVDYLLQNKGGTVKRTADDYKDIEDHYKEKLRMLLLHETSM